MLPEIHSPIPGPRSLACAAKLRRYESHNVTYLNEHFPIFWERAEGGNVWDVDGNRFLDLTSAFGVTGLGHRHPGVSQALLEQAAKLFHVMGDVHPSPLKADLCEALSALTYERWGIGTAKSILGNSGFEAVEAALKTAFLLTKKPGILAFEHAYHGLGYGTLAAGCLARFRDPFAGQLANLATEVPFPSRPEDTERILQQIDEALTLKPIGAILVEPIQGRGGQVVPPDGFLTALASLGKTHGALLIVDEIFTGLNRTGKLFAVDHEGVVPDLICLGKALTSGFPLSACVGSATLMDAAWPKSDGEALHTSTFLGNPLGCAMALASLKEHARPETAARVEERGQTLRALLAKIGPVRGRGLLLGLEILDHTGKPDGTRAAKIMLRCLQDGLIILSDGPEGHILALTAAFDIDNEELHFIAQRLEAALQE